MMFAVIVILDVGFTETLARAAEDVQHKLLLFFIFIACCNYMNYHLSVLNNNSIIDCKYLYRWKYSTVVLLY